MVAYILAFLAGIFMGVLGGGGSILTIPILVYLVGIEEKMAIALSLAIVGFSALPGVITHAKNKMIEYRSAFFFLVFSIIGTMAGVYFASLIEGKTQMTIFGVVLIGISLSMMFKKDQIPSQSYLQLAISSLVAGIVIGIIGIGGGFMIVPILFIFGGIDMKKSVATSLFVISLNALSGFARYAFTLNIDWVFLFGFIICSSVGTILGVRFASRVSQDKLKKSFSYFVLIMGISILGKNILS